MVNHDDIRRVDFFEFSRTVSAAVSNVEIDYTVLLDVEHTGTAAPPNSTSVVIPRSRFSNRLEAIGAVL